MADFIRPSMHGTDSQPANIFFLPLMGTLKIPGSSYDESLADCTDFCRCLLFGNDKENHETPSSNTTIY